MLDFHGNHFQLKRFSLNRNRNQPIHRGQTEAFWGTSRKQLNASTIKRVLVGFVLLDL